MSVATTNESESLVVAPVVDPSTCETSERLSWFDRFCSGQVIRRLRQLQHGRLAIRYACSEAVVGERSEAASTAVVNVHAPQFFRRIAMEGGMGAAESYLDGEWSSPDLTGVFRLLIQNEDAMESMRSSRFSPWHVVRRLEHLRNRNSKNGSRRNIHEHYDLGNEFFSLFLDETMMYSSAIFPTVDTTLKDASTEKIDRVCRRLNLQPHDRVVEIGTGWGGLRLSCGRQLWLPCHDNDDLAGAARLCGRADSGTRTRRPCHAAQERLPRSDGNLRQAGLTGDDRGRRSRVHARVLRHLQSPGQRRWSDDDSGDHHSRTAVRSVFPLC